MSTMNIMTDKGYLKRTPKGGGYVYRPRVTRKWTAQQMLGDVVNRVFDGSAAAVVLHLIESGGIDEKEQAELRKLLDTKGEKAS